MTAPFIDGFEDVADVARCFGEPLYRFNGPQDYRGYEVLCAIYGAGSYEGEAFLLVRWQSVLYEVNASHCSCYGLDGLFDPEETSVYAIRERLNHGFGHLFNDEQLAGLRGVLDAIDKGDL